MSSIKKDLNLPSPYQVKTKVEGHIETTHYRLAALASQTHGTIIVWAKSVSWQKWQEITGAEFQKLAALILDPRLVPLTKFTVQVSTGLTPA